MPSLTAAMQLTCRNFPAACMTVTTARRTPVATPPVLT